jgi:hypothetical protein
MDRSTASWRQSSLFDVQRAKLANRAFSTCSGPSWRQSSLFDVQRAKLAANRAFSTCSGPSWRQSSLFDVQRAKLAAIEPFRRAAGDRRLEKRATKRQSDGSNKYVTII